MDNTHIHLNIKNIESNNKDVSLNEVKNIECIDKVIFNAKKFRNMKLEYLKKLRTTNTNNKIDINISKSKVKQMIKSAPNNKLKIIEEQNRKNRDIFYDNFVIEPQLLERQIQSVLIVNNTKLDNILTYTTDIINELREYTNTNIDIDFILSKIRLRYENNELFKHKKKIFLLSFEDDTFKAVLETEQKYLDIILDWYESNNLSLDIEETEYQIPEYITKNELSNILYKNINYEYKDEYLNKYLPQLLNYLLSKKTLNKCEKNIFNSMVKEEIIDISDNNLLEELGVNMPDNIILKDNNKKNKWSPLISIKDTDGNFDVLSYNKSGIININIDNNNDNNKMYLAYNSDYNCLYPSFGDSCELIDKQERENLREENLIFVLFNPIYLQSIVVENPNKDTLYVINNHNEYGFIPLFRLCINKNNTELISFIKNEYHQHIFNNIEELNSCLNTTSGFIDYNNLNINKNTSKINEELEVKQFITTKFNLTDNIEDKMKASELYEIIIASPAINIDKDKINGFRNRLSKYLIELGLKKKRYNDGYYYYGIVNKLNNNEYRNINTVYEEMLKEREQMDK
jgi:hypothetical protein